MIIDRTIRVRIDTEKLEKEFSLCKPDEDMSEEELIEHQETLENDANRFIDEVAEDPYAILDALDYFNY